MGEFYNPIVRTFGRLRASLMRVLGVERRHVAPCMPLELLIPIERRREVWRQLRQDGFDMPGLELTSWDRSVGAFTVLKTAASIALATNPVAGLLSTLPISAITYGVTRPRAVHLPVGLSTIGDLVLWLTSFRDHLNSGYRWSRGDIAWRVRFVLSQALNVDIDQIQEHHTLLELGAE